MRVAVRWPDDAVGAIAAAPEPACHHPNLIETIDNFSHRAIEAIDNLCETVLVQMLVSLKTFKYIYFIVAVE